MSRATRMLSAAFLLTLLWLVLLFHSDTIPAITFPPVADQILPAIPLWLLVTFGAYSLANIGWSLFTFGDCPDAHVSLLKEIQAAKMDLRSRGVSID
ncbi:dolichol-phosphate mannosyltransferase subunit 3, partial [Entophlyctis helioformis]